MSIQIGITGSIEEAIRKQVAENMLYTNGSLPFGDDDSFIENGVVDSTGVLELVLFVEQTFGVKVQDSDVVPEHFDSVSRLARYVRFRMPATRGDAAEGSPADGAKGAS